MMQKNIFLLSVVLFLIGCETGTRYERNATKTTLEQDEPKSGLINRQIEILVNDEELDNDEITPRHSYIEPSQHYRETSPRTTPTNLNLNVKHIRKGKHDGYVRLVFDIYNSENAAAQKALYKAQYNQNRDDIVVLLQGYRKFSASLPSFSHESVIEQIYFEEYSTVQGYKLHIKLRQDAKVRIFDLKSPARIIFDIKPI